MPDRSWHKEVKVLLAILSGKEERMDASFGLDEAMFLQLVLMHKVSAQVLQYLPAYPGLLSAPNMARLENRCRQNAMTSLVQLQELVRIAGKLEDEGIPLAVIKGPQLSRMLYGREAIKESVDLDFMLPDPTRLEKVHTILFEAGYTRSNLNVYSGSMKRRLFLVAKREVAYFNPASKCAIDLHIRPGANTYLTAGRFRSFFEDFRSFDLESTLVQVPPDEKYLAYLCYHGALHQFSRLGWLMDIRTFLQIKKEDLDYVKVIKCADQLGSVRSLVLALLLLGDYFGDEVHHALKPLVVRSPRMKFLIWFCRNMLHRDKKYGFTLRGRFGKFIYVMLLTEGWAARVDWTFGIGMRMLVKLI
jgi:hypothetical protein